jgi:uncharacterized RDD family membrane protein YckC
MSWYYALKGEQKGPVEARDMLVLESAGVIAGKSKVWAEGMPEWRDFSDLREQVRVEAGEEDLTSYAVCAHSQTVMKQEEMVAYGERLVAPEHKDAFVQSLQEGYRLDDTHVQREMVYVGFWWRVLAFIIDSMVKGAVFILLLIPLILLIIPLISEFQGGATPDEVLGALGIGVVGAILLLVFGYFFFTIAYHTWMVGKYGGTVGKLALGFRVVFEDGSKISYMRAFGRYWAEVLSNMISSMIQQIVSFGLQFGLIFMGRDGPDEATAIAFGIIFILVYIVVYALSLFPWWMAARSPEKKTLHDIICKTRVVFK